MTIKQQGGVFGRNPTFNDVEVDGTLTTDNFTLDGTAVTATGAELNYLDITTLGRGEASKAVTADASGNVFLGSKTSLSDTNAGHAFAQGANAGLGYTARDGLIHSYNQLGSGGQTIRFLYQGSPAGYIDVYNTYATFRPSNGGGIDFSATSGTGTSELFDDYEEGTWTPAFSGNTGVSGMSYSLQEGNYTKVGNLVTANLRIIVSGLGTLTGTFVTITGLPFAATGAGQATVGYFVNVNGHKPTVGGYVASGQSVITMSATNSGNDDMIVANFPIASVTATTQLNMSVTYQAA